MDAVAELVERESAVGKTAVCSLNSDSVSPMFSCTEAEFGIRQQHRFGGVFRAWVSSLWLMQFLVSYRRMVGDGRMPVCAVSVMVGRSAMRIIPPFNVGEDSQASFLMRTEGSAIDQFTLKGSEEALAQCVKE